MGASYSRLTPGHKEAIYDLKKAGKSGRVIREKLEAGYNDLPPVKVGQSRVNQIARRLLDERDELYSSDVRDAEPTQGIRALTKRLMIVAEREVVRLERQEKSGQLDANKVGRLANALIRINALLERNEDAKPAEPTANDLGSTDRPSSFAERLLNGDEGDAVPDPVPETPTGAPAPIADVRLDRTGKPRGRPYPVPSDPHQPLGDEGGSGEVATLEGGDGAAQRADGAIGGEVGGSDGGGSHGVSIEHTI